MRGSEPSGNQTKYNYTANGEHNFIINLTMMPLRLCVGYSGGVVGWPLANVSRTNLVATLKHNESEKCLKLG